MPTETIQVKRYPNRRFYAKNTSKYVSLLELEEMIHNGDRVEIRDSQNGDNITRQVLAQIILDRQPEKIALFPTDMLHFIVRSNEMMSDFLRDYFRHSLTYLEYLQKHGATAKKISSPMHWAKAWLDEMSGRADQPSAGIGKEAAGADKESALLSRVEQLEERIRQLESEAE